MLAESARHDTDNASVKPAVKLGELSMKAKDSDLTLRCNALSVLDAGYNQITLASAVGSSSAVKAFSASLNVKGIQTTYRAECEGIPRHADLYRVREGYDVYKAKLGYNTWHVLAIARLPGLMPILSETALWRELRSDRYTTPLLRTWMPYLLKQLVDDGKLRRCRCFQVESAVLNVTSDALDLIVSQGLRNGAISIA